MNGEVTGFEVTHTTPRNEFEITVSNAWISIKVARGNRSFMECIEILRLLENNFDKIEEELTKKEASA